MTAEATERLAQLLDLDPQTRSEVAAMLSGLTEDDRDLAAAVRAHIIAGLARTKTTEQVEQQPISITASGAAWVAGVFAAAGPLAPAAVGDAFEQATSFFAAHFPDQPARVAVCASWLLDPHLGRASSADSNIATFQRLFTAYGEPRDDRLDAVYFTFGRRSLAGLGRLPRDTALQRVVLDRLAAGEHWTVVRGYRSLLATPS